MESYLIGAIIFCFLALICNIINLYCTLKESKEQEKYNNSLISEKEYFRRQAEDFKESRWNHDKPTANRIVAKYKESFCHNKDYYEVIYKKELATDYYYYDVAGEEIPLSAIEKWIEI